MDDLDNDTNDYYNDEGRSEEVDSDNSDISEAEVESENSDDEPTDDFDTEWTEFQNLVSLTGEKSRAFWQDDHFRKAFQKF